MPGAPLEDMTLQGYEPPRVTQFNVFLANCVGKMHELADALDGHALKVAAFSIVDAADFAVIRLVTNDAGLTRKLLERNRVSFSETKVLAVEIGPGQSLSKLCRVLLGAEVNIAYAYPLLFCPHDCPAIVLLTDDLTLAGQVLRRKLFPLLGENDLGGNDAAADEPAEPPVI